MTGDMFACLEVPSPSNPVLRNTAMDVTIRSLRVTARRRHAAEKPGGSATFSEQEEHNDLTKATMILRRPVRLQPLRQAPWFRRYDGNSSR
jgi:hypothetical protein